MAKQTQAADTQAEQIQNGGTASAEEKARFRIGVFAVIERGGRYLLARRRDIGWWNLPGGGMEYGETIEEALTREVREEVGLAIQIARLVGVYSKPQKREVVLTFLCHPAPSETAEPGTSDEVSESGWFSADTLPEPLLPKHRQRLEDALRGQREALLRTQATSTEADQRLEKPM
jgi:ADP-ribose pyrophosphatase YjhB (NUDIX family)